MNERELLKQCMEKDKKIADLHALIDTLQTNLRTAVNYLSKEDREKIESVQSYKWCSKWTINDDS